MKIFNIYPYSCLSEFLTRQIIFNSVKKEGIRSFSKLTIWALETKLTLFIVLIIRKEINSLYFNEDRTTV